MRDFETNGFRAMLLLLMDHILRIGIEGVLYGLSEVTEDEVRERPYVARALAERGLLKSSKSV